MPSEDAAEILKRRQAALLDKWAAGKRLTDAEMDEIRALLPRAPEPPEVLQLEAQVEGESPAYQKYYKDYAAQYGQTPRTINRWMAKAAPLDHPHLMPAWWATAMKKRAPDHILALAAAAAPAVSSEPAAPPGASLPRSPASDLTPLQQMRSVADEAFAKLQLAQTGGNAGEIAMAQTAFNKASDALRKMEIADPAIRAAQGKSIDREKLRSALTDLHTSLAQTWRNFCKKVRRETRGMTAAEEEETWQRETDKVFARFHAGEFSDLTPA